MSPFDPSDFADVRLVLSDLDDTLTLDGVLPSASYGAIERLGVAGIDVVIVSGRPAGWCDLMARLWPVKGVVGENGAFYFSYVRDARRMDQKFAQSADVRARNRQKLDAVFAKAVQRHPHLKLASDQPFRISDIAIDICEDVEPLAPAVVDDVVALFRDHGASVKVSSIHINTWIGQFDKLGMSLDFLETHCGWRRDGNKSEIVYAGDSPNDEPMFEYFDLTVGVANVRDFLDAMTHRPRWITQERGGLGFNEFAEVLLAR